MRRFPKLDLDMQRRTTRRGMLLAGLQGLFVGTLAYRMRHLQVEQAGEFQLMADQNSVKIRLIPPARGLIHDRKGVLIAGNEQNYRVTITREDVEDVPGVLHDLSRLITLPDDEIDRLIKDIDKRPPTLPITVAERLSWEEFSRVAVNAPVLTGITTEVGLSRFYPHGGDFAHVLGYVGPVSDYDLSKMQDPDPLLQIPKFQIGKLGIEAKYEDQLRGKAGTRRIEVNATGREMREIDRREGDPGANLRLTLDARLQNYVLARLGDNSAAAVVLDLQDGAVRAIASAPSFDPNLFVRGISSADYQTLTENDHRPLADKTVQGAYPPGSTFKMVTALAALEAGVTTPDETVYCRGYTELGDRRFHCWKKGGHGSVSMVESLEQSCDVYYYEMAQRVGIDKIADMARRLGVGVRPDLPMSAIAEGNAPTKAWKRERYGKEWLIGDTLNSGIGQGYVLASPLQLALMMARVATGKALEPRLVQAVNDVDVAVAAPESLGIPEAHLRPVRGGLFAVMNGKSGTARASRIAEPTMQMCGKTGTAQVRNISAGEHASGVVKNDNLPWKQRDHALFVCFAPADAPRIAVSIVIEHGGGGSTAAAPIARDILLQALYDGFPPLTAYPEGQRSLIEEQRKTLPLADPASFTGGSARA
ncbi:MAG: penicillin-binding protein 2 [Proteobacteria bacterium]|nr:penicillin-binding protein 2 [Pseudomonadota bacterium]MBS0572575.1 penicillin-binding protein 2 [Pseudomonadota bacterium]